MNSSSRKALVALFAGVIAGTSSSALIAQASGQRQMPKSWTYEVDSRGNRVPKVNRVAQPDGSWREEIRQGNCVTVRERSATGEFRETQQCKADKFR